MDPTAGWSLHLGLPKAASTLLQQHLFGCHPDLDYLGKLEGNWISPEVEKFVKRITAAQELDDSLALGMREGYIEPAIRRGRLPVLSSEGLSVGLPDSHEKRAEFLEQVWSPCSVLFFYTPSIDSSRVHVFSPAPTICTQGHGSGFERQTGASVLL